MYSGFFEGSAMISFGIAPTLAECVLCLTADATSCCLCSMGCCVCSPKAPS